MNDVADSTQHELFRHLCDLVKASGLDAQPLAERSGFLLRLSPVNWDVKPVVLAGSAHYWLMISIPNASNCSSEEKALRKVNEMNIKVPFGVFTLDGDYVTYRNTIRRRTLSDVADLNNWVITGLSVVDAATKELKEITSP